MPVVKFSSHHTAPVPALVRFSSHSPPYPCGQIFESPHRPRTPVVRFSSHSPPPYLCCQIFESPTAPYLCGQIFSRQRGLAVGPERGDALDRSRRPVPGAGRLGEPLHLDHAFTAGRPVGRTQGQAALVSGAAGWGGLGGGERVLVGGDACFCVTVTIHGMHDVGRHCAFSELCF